MRNVTKEAFLSITVRRPPLLEQEQIGRYIDCWNHYINTTIALIDNKVRLKRALVQVLLTGRRLFGALTKQSWHEVRLQDVTTECTVRNGLGHPSEAVMAVTKAEGIVPMRERLIGSDLQRYKVVRKDWFAYNPMRLNIGSIARWSGPSDVVVSPDYVVFRCNQEPGLVGVPHQAGDFQ
jgi:type I restriction enzyme S subunit